VSLEPKCRRWHFAPYSSTLLRLLYWRLNSVSTKQAPHTLAPELVLLVLLVAAGCCWMMLSEMAHHSDTPPRPAYVP